MAGSGTSTIINSVLFGGLGLLALWNPNIGIPGVLSMAIGNVIVGGVVLWWHW